MSAAYSKLHRLTEEGVTLFRRVMTGVVDESALDVANPVYAQPLEGTGSFHVENFETAREMASAICKSFGNQSPQSLAGDEGLWCWLTFVLVDLLFPTKAGVRQIGASARWFPAPPNDWLKAQRHLVRMPVLLFHAFGNDADHLLCGRPSIGPEIREQLTSQQDMFSANFQRACRALYYDEQKSTTKKGAGSKSLPGTPRRLAAVRQQLDVTWDMTDLPADRILDLLPAEFEGFKKTVVSA